MPARNGVTSAFLVKSGWNGVDDIFSGADNFFAAYQDLGYAAFKSANVSRTPMVYVGANDGMLHAFYATLDTAANGGQEAWAVIPSSVLSNMLVRAVAVPRQRLQTAAVGRLKSDGNSCSHVRRSAALE